MYWYVSIFQKSIYDPNTCTTPKSPNNGFRWFPLGKLSHLGLEQLPRYIHNTSYSFYSFCTYDQSDFNSYYCKWKCFDPYLRFYWTRGWYNKDLLWRPTYMLGLKDLCALLWNLIIAVRIISLLSFWPQQNVWPSAHFYYQKIDENEKSASVSP